MLATGRAPLKEAKAEKADGCDISVQLASDPRSGTSACCYGPFVRFPLQSWLRLMMEVMELLPMRLRCFVNTSALAHMVKKSDVSPVRSRREATRTAKTTQ